MASKAAARKHIEEIRRKKFSIGVGAEPNPLTEDLHHSVHNLSLELYTKDIHFLMELMQNAEDNEYPEGVEPSLEFVLTSKDITGTGAPMTLLVFNNEVGFSRRNMESLCSVGRSTKKGRRQEGFVGEKGIGFKSVFLISKQPYIFSSGYQVRFSDEPNQECCIGYIVPEWIEMIPTIEVINNVYGSERKLPMTTIILPLKSEKVKAVKKQLSEVHPELLLFLSKIKQLSVREQIEQNDDSTTDGILSSISISSRTELLSTRDGSTSSYFVQLSARDGIDKKCWYYMWKQALPVKPESKIDGRSEVSEWAISLAFPCNERLTRGAPRSGIFAFLPTEMVTGFPFIIHADFMLASSRETILMDNKWNLGILDCLPSMFVDACVSYVKSSKQPLSNLVKMFKFLPLDSSSFAALNNVRETIRKIMKEKPILPYELFSDKQMDFCKPVETIRLLPEFRKLLKRAKNDGLSLEGISAEGRFILHSRIDDAKYDRILNFLGVKNSTNDGEWYQKCINICNLVDQVSEDVYLDILCFIMDNIHLFNNPSVKPFNTLVKYVRRMASVTEHSKSTSGEVYYAVELRVHSWLDKCNMQFAGQNGRVFISSSMHQALSRHERRSEIVTWLQNQRCIVVTTVRRYIDSLLKAKLDVERVILISHFLYHSFEEKLVSESDVYSLCSKTFPIVDHLGYMHTEWKQALVPAAGSKWHKLFGYNPFRNQQYVALGEKIYCQSKDFAGSHTPNESLLCFLRVYTKALDLPELLPPDVELPISKRHLTAEQAFILLDWIQNLKSSNSLMPVRFITSIQSVRWMKTNTGYKSPNKSFLVDGNQESILTEMTKVFANFSIIDEQYYRGCIKQYSDVLKSIGVRFVSENSYAALNELLVSFVSSNMTKDQTFSLLKYIRHAKNQGQLSEILLKTLKEKEWLETTQGYKSPSGSVFMRSKTDAIAQITNLSVVDEAVYGEEINSHLPELELLGAVVDVEDVYKHIIANFTFPTDLAEMKRDSVLLLLRCIREMGSSHLELIEKIKNKLWMRTSIGLSCPRVSIIFDAQWGPLADVVKIPVIDEAFYGNGIRSFMGELKRIGVAVDLDGVQDTVAAQFRSAMTLDSPTCADVISLLNCIKYFREEMPSMLHELTSTLVNIAFIKTRHGHKSPPCSILFDSKWGMICHFVDLPLIDDGFYGIEIYSYRSELEQLGVIVDFNKGSIFVATGLKLPKEPGDVPAETALLLLQCIRNLLKNLSICPLPLPFLDNFRESKWLKTYNGYRRPMDSLLFDSAWESDLNCTDGPFLEQKFYGPNICEYREELKVIGVKVEIEEVCRFFYENLGFLDNLQVITQIYGFLNKFKWKPSAEFRLNCEVWIPGGQNIGKWVISRDCVLKDESCLFSSSDNEVYVLDKYYGEPLLELFSSAFEVRGSPSVNDYVSLWKSWELNKQHEVTHEKCCFCLKYIVANWHSHADVFMKNILKLPAAANHIGDKVYLMMNNEVCIPDDPELETLFTNASKEPLFVWYPHQNEPSISLLKLRQIYSSLGVKKLSELVTLDANHVSSDSTSANQDMRDALIVEGLIRIILGFLAGPQVCMSMKERHAVVKALLQLAICDTDKLVEVSCILQFPSSKSSPIVRIRRVVFWEKKSRKLFVHKSSFEEQRTSVEFITYFAREISEFVSQEINLPTNDLCKLIQMGFAFDCKVDAVEFLLKAENLQTLVEDEEFITSVFSSGQFGTTTPKRKVTVKKRKLFQ